MSIPFFNAREYHALKSACGEIYQRIKNEEPVEDSLHDAVLSMLGLDPRTTIVDYCLFGTIQFKLITDKLTLLYINHDDIERRQTFIYFTPDRPITRKHKSH